MLTLTFSGDESASFLALVETIKVQLLLVRIDLATNPENALEHAEHAVEHLDADTIEEIAERNERLGREVPASLTDLHKTLESGNYTAAGVDDMVDNAYDLLDEIVTVRIDNPQLTNSTLQALVLANLVVAFESDRDGNFDIYVMNSDGTGQNRLTDNEPPAEADLEPSWSPDGTKIAFASFVVDNVIDGVRFGHYDIFVMNADGTGLTNLTNGGDSNVSPSWSSDGP